MSSKHNPADPQTLETPADTDVGTQQRLADAQKEKSGGGIGDIIGMIGDFLKMLFDMLFGHKDQHQTAGGADAPEMSDGEEPGAHSMSTSDKMRIGRIMIQHRIATKWNAYKTEHAGETVTLTSPVEGASTVRSGFGHREAPAIKNKAGKVIGHGSSEHGGLDLVPANGSDRILAAADGFVMFSDMAGTSGNTVIIGHADGTATVYRHMTGADMPALGSVVNQGDIIGRMGSTGNSTGKHLHFEVRNQQNVAIVPHIEGESLGKGAHLAAADGVHRLPVQDVNGHAGPNVAMNASKPGMERHV